MVEYRKKPQKAEAEDEPVRVPRGTVTVRFFEEGTEVEIENFETMTPGKLQHSFMQVLKEWQRQQQIAVRAQSKKERKNASQV